MVSVALLIRIAAASMISSAAFAADMPQPLPQPVPQIQYQPVPVVMEQPQGAWYLRGDIGVGIMSNLDFVFLQNPANHSDFTISHSSIADTVFFDAGIGYEWNNWLRFDITAEYRSKAAINAFGTFTCGGGCVNGDQFTANLRSTILLANAYVDLGTWNCVTPFVGFGIGGAWNTFGDLVDLGVGTSGNGIGTNATNLNFAWALHAGLAYNVTQNFTIELAYKYLNFGSVTDQIFCQGGCNPDSFRLQNLTSQDVMLGMRWRFPIEAAPLIQAPVMLQPAPMVVPQQPVMVPQQPMVYPQPAISTRG